MTSISIVILKSRPSILKCISPTLVSPSEWPLLWVSIVDVRCAVPGALGRGAATGTGPSGGGAAVGGRAPARRRRKASLPPGTFTLFDEIVTIAPNDFHLGKTNAVERPREEGAGRRAPADVERGRRRRRDARPGALLPLRRRHDRPGAVPVPGLPFLFHHLPPETPQGRRRRPSLLIRRCRRLRLL